LSEPIRFYLDYISSNAYLAWEALLPLAARFGRSVEPMPVLFAGLLNAHGQLGPAEVLPKAIWMARNNLRKAAVLGIPLRPPPAHPFNPLLPLRATLLPMADAERRALVTGLLRAEWTEGRDVSEPAVVREVAAAVGLDGERVVAEAAEPGIKQALRAATDAAIQAGVFGVPTLIVDGELFWGHDDLPFVERRLAGEDPLDEKQLEPWMGEPPRIGAWRPNAPPRREH
jgi:2-hydroxychromene-2-carboxylate isomerase